MANKTDTKGGLSLPTLAMIYMAFLGAAVVGGSFEIIKYWPQPQSVEPYFGWQVGMVWGFVAGGVSGFVLGFLTDDNHFKRD